MQTGYFFFYTEASIFCILAFVILLINEIWRTHRDDRQIKFDNVLMAHILYFFSDIFWAGVLAGVIPRTLFTVLFFNLTNYIFMAAIGYTWFFYAALMEKIPIINTRRGRNIVRLPIIIMTLVMVVVYLISPHSLIDEHYNLQMLYYPLMLAAPICYVVVSCVCSIVKARRESDPIERRTYLFLGIYPLIVVAVGIAQVVVINAPLLCFACTLMMLFFYIRSMNNLISLDPLTQLNNRGQLQRYINEEENMQREGLTTFVIMIDVNDFKNINDTYGHAEGDRALILISDALREAVGEAHMPAFLGRYGGDEFILIVYARDEGDVIRCVDIIRRDAENACRQQKTPYLIGLGIGWEEMQEGEDFQNCMERADRKLYIDKRQRKQQKDQQAR